MKERPIIFSGDSVRAILEGRKTQTRRVAGLEDVNGYPGLLDGMSPLGPLGYKGFEVNDYNLKPSMKRKFKKSPLLFHWFLGERRSLNEINPIPVRCPYGAPGDWLWVRETWQALQPLKDIPLEIINPRPGICALAYEADEGERFEKYKTFGSKLYQGPWRSPLFMPRWASRITLELTGVRVERVQEISEADAIAEGIERINDHPHWAWKDYTGNGQDLSPIMSYQSLWDSLNARRGYPWASNPYVWVLEFKRIDASEGGDNA